MSIAPDFVKFKEMYILCSIWDFVGTHCLQGRYVGRSYQDCDNCQSTTTKDSKAAKGNIGSHRLLQQVYNKRIYGDYCTNGETIEERCEF